MKSDTELALETLTGASLKLKNQDYQKEPLRRCALSGLLQRLRLLQTCFVIFFWLLDIFKGIQNQMSLSDI